MKIIVAAAFYILYGAYAFSGQARTEKISSDCAPIRRRFRAVFEATRSSGKLFQRQNQPLLFCSVIFSCSRSCFPFWDLR